MSLQRNIIANYVSLIYVTLIGIVMVPLYVRYMGAEAYGLVGFFVMLQAFFQLLDIGLTPTMAREAARFNGGASDAHSLRMLLRALEGIFLTIAALGGMAMIVSADAIASIWLKVQELPLAEVKNSIVLMALIVALRWICGLYRGAITGFELMVWLCWFNTIVATFRYVLVIPIFMYVGTDPTVFFSFQLVVAVGELAVLMWQTYRLLPLLATGQRVRWGWAPVRGVLKFSLSIAFTSSVWVLVTQTDKLVLSKLLPLADYAYFTLAVLVSSGVIMISGPISAALLPRLTKLSAEGSEDALIRLYRNATQMVSTIAIPAALVLAVFAEQVVWAWTGDADIARKVAPVLTPYALGNGILALGAFPYYLQFSKGDLKLHLIGSLLFLILLVPSLVWATWHYSMLGAGYSWFGANAVYFLFWVPKVHNNFVKGLHMRWLLQDVGLVALVAFVMVVGFKLSLTWPQDRLSVFIQILAISLVTLGASAAVASTIRNALLARLRITFIASK